MFCRSCGKPLNPPDAAFCPACGQSTDLTTPIAAPRSASPRTDTAGDVERRRDKDTRNGCVGCLGLLVVVVVIAFIVSVTGTPSSNKSAADKLRDSRTWAQVQCQDAIRAQLASPSTANFPYSEQHFGYVGNGSSAAATGVVDAQNGFGAMIRQSYRCALRPANDTMWTVVAATMTP